MAGIGNTSCESLFLDEGEVKVRMYGEDFDSSQLSELAASQLPDCEGIVLDCLALTFCNYCRSDTQWIIISENNMQIIKFKRLCVQRLKAKHCS